MAAQPPKRLALGDVPAYIERTHGVNFTRQTVYNWAKKGKRGMKLWTTTVAGQLYTTEEQVDEFFIQLG